MLEYQKIFIGYGRQMGLGYGCRNMGRSFYVRFMVYALIYKSTFIFGVYGGFHTLLNIKGLERI